MKNCAAGKEKRFREKKTARAAVGPCARLCAAHACAAPGRAAGRPKGCLLLLGWKTIRRKKKGIDPWSSCSSALVLERAGAGRGWPEAHREGRPVAGMGMPWPTAPRGGGSDDRDASGASPVSSAVRPWRELGWSLGAAMRWARGYGEAGNGFLGLHRYRGWCFLWQRRSWSLLPELLGWQPPQARESSCEHLSSRNSARVV